MRLLPFILFTLPLIASADMTITATEQVSQKVRPDIMRGILSYQEESRSSETIKKDLNAIVAEVKRQDPNAKQCRGGGYRLTPRYSYKNQKQQFEGYTGLLSFECSFDNIEPYNKLTAAIDKVSAQAIKKTQGALSWVVSDKTRDAVREELRGQLIEKAYVQAKRYSKLTDSECKVSTVAFGGAPQPAPITYRASAMMAEASAPTESPLVSEEEIPVEATLVYICKEAGL